MHVLKAFSMEFLHDPMHTWKVEALYMGCFKQLSIDFTFSSFSVISLLLLISCQAFDFLLPCKRYLNGIAWCGVVWGMEMKWSACNALVFKICICVENRWQEWIFNFFSDENTHTHTSWYARSLTYTYTHTHTSTSNRCVDVKRPIKIGKGARDFVIHGASCLSYF